MKNYLVSLFIMIVFVIVGAGVANACVIEKATDVDIGAIELATSQGVEAYVVAVSSYDYLLISKVNSYEFKKVEGLFIYESLKLTGHRYIPKPFYESIYNDDHRSDWLNKEILKDENGNNRPHYKHSYWRLWRNQTRLRQLT